MVGGGCVGVPVGGCVGVPVGGGAVGGSAAGPRGSGFTIGAGWTVPAFAHQTLAWVLSYTQPARKTSTR